MIEIHENVISYCASHNLCRGCDIGCVAPVAPHQFDEWMAKTIKIIEQRLGEKDERA